MGQNVSFDRLPAKKNTPSKSIAHQEPAIFEVDSEDGTLVHVYTVSFKEAFPLCTCTCIDFKKYKSLPCKHILAITTHVAGYSWHELSHDYTRYAPFVLDENCTGEERTSDIDQDQNEDQNVKAILK